ncbi:MAG: hypothetical protein Ct9H90mP22_1000 [Gammaproteobacteria bacterium]|nr:MAG: hypothetical protein Ct9H90mP22_1000 [Gammaproteobacteria bacterium]
MHDLITIPHGHSSKTGINFSVTQSPIHTPYQEYLEKWNTIHQFFLKTLLFLTMDTYTCLKKLEWAWNMMREN